MTTLKRRDPSLSVRAALAADLESRKRDRASKANRGDLYSDAELNTRSYRQLARNARMFGC